MKNLLYILIEKINRECLFFKCIGMRNFGVLLLCMICLSWVMVWCSTKEAKNTDQWDFVIQEVDADQVLSYNDNIRNFSIMCIDAEESMWDVYNSYNWWSIDDVKLAIDNTVSECKDAMFKINDLWAWEWDASLKDGVISLIQKMLEKYEKLYETLPFLPLLSEWLVEDDAVIYEWIKAELNSLDWEIIELNDELSEIQYSFAENHWYELEQDEQ